MSRISQASVILAVWCHVLASPGATAVEGTAFASGILRLVPDRKQTFQFIDGPVKIRTYAGDIALNLQDVRRISLDRTTGLYVMDTRRRDRWRAVLQTLKFSYYDLDEVRTLTLDPETFLSLDITSPLRDPWRPEGFLQVTFRDGCRTFLQPDGLVLSLANEAGTWDLPAACAQAIRFLPVSGTPDVRATLTFPSGRLETLALAHRNPQLKAEDSFGNRLKIYYRDVRDLFRCTTDGQPARGANTTDGSGAVPEQPVQAAVTAMDGRVTAVRLPFAVWTVRGALGSLRLPTPLLREIGKEADPSVSFLATVYGERFLGSIRPESLTVSATDGSATQATLRHARQRSVALNTRALPAPDGWLMWRLTSGDLFLARFAEPYLKLLERGTTENADGQSVSVESDKILAVRSNGAGTFEFATPDVTLRNCRPASRRAELMLLANGARCAVPWKRVDAAARDLKAAANPLAAGTGARPNVSVAFETLMGPVEIDVGRLYAIHHNVPADASCFETIYGEILVSRLQVQPGRPDPPPVILSGNARDRLPPGWLACRLTSGDVFYTRFLDQSLSVQAEDGDGGRLEVMPLSLRRLRRLEERNTFLFETSGGEIRGRPSARTAQVRILGCAGLVDIPFKAIDVVQTGPLEELPPLTHFRPGLTPGQNGETPLPGGTFVMGRTRGAGLDDEVPPHKVVLPPFFMDACEVTKAQFAAFVRDTGYKSDAERAAATATWQTPGFRQRADEPAVCLTWYDAVEFCNWRSKRTGLAPCYDIGAHDATVVCRRHRTGYRLPTEAEWEYAARSAGRELMFPWGDEAALPHAAAMANFMQPDGSARDTWVWTHPAKSFAPNPIGLYAMAGNVWEWCEDWYLDRAYRVLGSRDALDPCIQGDVVTGLTRRVMRGGSFHNRLDVLRCASRAHGVPGAFAPRVGFRCVRNAKARQE